MTEIVQSRNQLIGLVSAIALVCSTLAGGIAGPLGGRAAAWSDAELRDLVQEEIQAERLAENKADEHLQIERERADAERVRAERAERAAAEANILASIAESEARLLQVVQDSRMPTRDRIYRREMSQWMREFWVWLADALEPAGVDLPRDMPQLTTEPRDPNAG